MRGCTRMERRKFCPVEVSEQAWTKGMLGERRQRWARISVEEGYKGGYVMEENPLEATFA